MNIKNDKEDIIFFKTNAFSEKGITVLEDGSVEIEGYASTKDVDSYYEIVDPEAFTEGLKRFEMNPVMLLQHNRDKPIGFYTKATITKQGLKVKGIVKHNTDGIIDQIKSGTMKGFSIGFRPTEYEYVEKVIDGQAIIVTIIKKLELREISVVSIPANPYTLFQAVGDYFKNLTNDNMKDLQTKDGTEQKSVFTQEEMLKAVELIRQEKTKKLDIVNEKKSDEVAIVENVEAETQEVAEEIINSEKSIKADPTINTETGISDELSIDIQLKDLLKIEKGLQDSYYITSVFTNYFIYNLYNYNNEQGLTLDKYFKRDYKILKTGLVELSGEDIEVEAKRLWVEAAKSARELEKKSVENTEKKLDGVENVAGTATEVTQTEEKAASVEKSDEAKGIVISTEKMNLLLDVLETYKKNIDDLNAKVEKIGVSKGLTYTKTNESVEKKSVGNLDFINKTKVN